MEKQTIRAFIDENRQVAKTQLARWDAVDPSRLLEACAIIESLLDAGAALDRPSDGGRSLVFDDVLLTSVRSNLATLGPHPVEVELTFQIGPQSSIPSNRQIQALLNTPRFLLPARIELCIK